MSNKKNDFWYYTRRERRATITLSVLVLVIFVLPAVYRFQPKDGQSPDIYLFLKELEQFDAAEPGNAVDNPVASLFHFDPNSATQEELTALGLPASTANTIIRYRQKGGSFQRPEDLQKIYNLAPEAYQRLRPFIQIEGSADEQAKRRDAPATQPVKLFTFDPNTASFEDLRRLGLSGKTAGNLVKYREKGGRFRSTEDMGKIYGLSNDLFERLAPYVRIAPPDTPAQAETENSTSPRAVPASYESPAPIAVDINQATAEHWQQLYGIGPVLSGRIIKFRDKLGGFSSVDQVAETYGLPDSTFQTIRSQLRFSPITHPVAINKLSAEQLKDHPYIKWQQANVIVAYRREHGAFRDLEDLRKIHALTDEFLRQLAPYLQFD